MGSPQSRVRPGRKELEAAAKKVFSHTSKMPYIARTQSWTIEEASDAEVEKESDMPIGFNTVLLVTKFTSKLTAAVRTKGPPKQ